MSGIKYCALDENEEVPYEFVAIRNVKGETEFCASFVNTNFLAYENGVLLKFHQRNDELRAENAKLRELCKRFAEYTSQDRCDGCACKSRCNDGELDECWQLTEIRRLERELGVGGWR